jgi:MFS family permease
MLSLATFGVGFVTRPIGGIVIGHYSDRAGRRPAMILSFAMMGSAIIVLALTPSYARSASPRLSSPSSRAWCRAFRSAARSAPPRPI